MEFEYDIQQTPAGFLLRHYVEVLSSFVGLQVSTLNTILHCKYLYLSFVVTELNLPSQIVNVAENQ